MPDPEDPTKAPDFGMRRTTRRQLQNATISLAAQVNRLSRRIGRTLKASGKSATTVDKATETAATNVLNDMSQLSRSVASLLKKLGVK